MTYPQLFVDKVIKSVTRKKAKTKNEISIYTKHCAGEIAGSSPAMTNQIF